MARFIGSTSNQIKATTHGARFTHATSDAANLFEMRHQY
jgi:hypothetical protein